MAFTYMLRCSDGTYYVGSTARPLEQRIYEHNAGMGAGYTRRRHPVELVWHEEYQDVGLAFAREKQVQGWSRKKREALIAGDYSVLPGLARAASEATA